LFNSVFHFAFQSCCAAVGKQAEET